MKVKEKGRVSGCRACMISWLLVWLQGATYTGGARLDGKVGLVQPLSISIHWHSDSSSSQRNSHSRGQLCSECIK